MNGLTAHQRAIVSAALRGLLLMVLAPAGAMLWAQQRVATASVTINVLAATPCNCQIDTFTADATTIDEGESTTLEWTTTGATSASIDQGVGALAETELTSGSRSVTPTDTTTYTLTASDDDDATADATQSITITVNPQCGIGSFSASPSTITLDDKTTLEWTTTGATSASIDQGVGTIAVEDLASGSADDTPPDTTNPTYTLTASGGICTTPVTASVTVTVLPKIDSFSASPTMIDEGGSSELSWETTGATSVSIPGTIGTLAVDSSQRVMPPDTTTYTLTATDAEGDTNDATAEVTVNQPECDPEIDTFTVSSSPITVGDSTTLEWTTTGATSASIDQGVGTIAVEDLASGSQNVTPPNTTNPTYTLTASCTGASVTASVQVTVLPKIDSFSASSTTITVGDPTTLEWTTTGATSASIDQNVGSVTQVASGSQNVTPPTTTIYTLTATDAESDTATATETVTVVDPPVIDSFTIDAPTIDEGASTTLRWMTTGATSVSLSQDVGTDIGSVTPVASGSVSVTPTATTTYELTAKNSADSPATDTATVGVTVLHLPPTASLEANPTEFFGLTDPVELTWSTSRATSASIEPGVGSVTPVAVGSVTVYPEITTTYTLTASGPGGSAITSVEVFNVDLQRSLTATLTADAESITAGGSTTLRWTTEGADSATLSQDVGSDIGALAETELASGSRSISPTATTTYTLTASSGTGEDAVTATATVTITVTQP